MSQSEDWSSDYWSKQGDRIDNSQCETGAIENDILGYEIFILSPTFEL